MFTHFVFFQLSVFCPPPHFRRLAGPDVSYSVTCLAKTNLLDCYPFICLGQTFLSGPDVSCSVTLLLSINLSGLEISSLAQTDQIQLLGKDKTTSQLSIYLSGPDVSPAQTFLILTTAFQTLPQN